MTTITIVDNMLLPLLLQTPLTHAEAIRVAPWQTAMAPASLALAHLSSVVVMAATRGMLGRSGAQASSKRAS